MIEGTKMQSAARLREEFDRSFALPQRERQEARRGFLLVTPASAGRPVALAVQGVCSIEHVSAVTPAPSRAAALIGLAGLRGTVVPVFRMALLLGEGGSGMSQAWQRRPVFALVELEDGQRLGLGFERLEQFLLVEPLDVLAGPDGEMVRVEDELVQVIEPRRMAERLRGGQGSGTPGGTDAGMKKQGEARL